jgi:hypothetical protein
MSILDKIRQKVKELDEKKRRFWTPKDGNNLVRIMQWAENEPFYYESRQHFIPWGGRNEKGMVLACLEPAKGIGSCPACNVSKQLEDSDNQEENETGKRISATSRYFYNIIDLNQPEMGVQIFSSYSDKILQDLLGYYMDPECGDFSDPKTGRNIAIHKVAKGKSGFAEYDTKVKMASTKIANRDWIKGVKDLRTLVPKPSVADMKALLGEAAAAGSSDNGGVIEPRTLKKKTSKQELIDSLPCYGKEYRKLPSCPTCPVKMSCKGVYMEAKVQRAKIKAKKSLRADA